jgi:WD40 repeat protein
MSTPVECPQVERWPALLDETVPPDQRERYGRHLESCAVCQERLDRATECGDDLWRLAQELGDPTLVPADATLVQVVERLLEAKAMDRTTPKEPVHLLFLHPAERSDLLGTLGGYEVQAVIGHGGMGVVLKAFDPALHRLVAIKVMAPILAGSATSRQRFMREAQAAAAVRHDHIVTVHGVHEADGLPYLVMQYIAGESLQDRLDRTGPLEVADVVRIGFQIASGLAAAHRQGLIHRDIKPANILLEDGLARVKITDFGLARMVDDVPLTQSGVVAGTPEYMAPEQARGDPVDHRADLFSLGSVLYAMATGVPPFRASTSLSVVRQVCDQTPTSIQSLNPAVPAWLEAMIGLLHAKDPTDRFQNAGEVTTLLEGYLADVQQPVTVPAPVLTQRQGDRGTRRNRDRQTRRKRLLLLVFMFPCLLVCLLLAALGLPKALWMQAALPPEQPTAPGFYVDFRNSRPVPASMKATGVDEYAVIKPEDEGLRITLPANRKRTDMVGVSMDCDVKGNFEITVGYDLLRANQPMKGHGVGLELYITTATQRPEGLGFYRMARVKEGDVYLSTRMTTSKDGAKQYKHEVSPTSSRSGQLRLTRDGENVAFWVAEGPMGAFRKLFVNHVGPEDLKSIRIAAFPGWEPNVVDLRIKDLRIRGLNAGEAPAGPVSRLRGHTGPVHNVRFTRNGRLVSASGWPQGDRTVRVWDLATGRERRKIVLPGEIHSLDLDRDGRFALAGLNTGAVGYLDLETGQVVRMLKIHGQAVGWVAFAADGQHGCSTSDEGTAKLWDLTDGKQVAQFHVKSKRARGGALLPDGRRLLTGDSGGALQIWDLITGQEVKQIAMDGSPMIDAVALASGGRQALAAGVGGVRLHDLETGQEVRHFQDAQEEVHQADVSPDGRRLIAGSFDGKVRLWDFQTGAFLRVLGSHKGFVFSVAFSPDGRIGASGGGGENLGGKFVAGIDHDIRLWNLEEPPADVASSEPSGGRAWLAAAAILFLVIALSLIGLWWLLRPGAGPASTPPPLPIKDNEPKPTSPPPPLGVQCGGCGLKLKVKAELAGKKVRCPQCGGAVVLPAIRTIGPDRGPL